MSTSPRTAKSPTQSRRPHLIPNKTRPRSTITQRIYYLGRKSYLDHVLEFMRFKSPWRGHHSSSPTVFWSPLGQADSRLISSLKACQHPDGGFSGGHGQIAHLAPTYAALNALALFGGDDAFDFIDREKLYTWMMSLKQQDGGFLMHHGGEEDARCVHFCDLSADVDLHIALWQ